jgi:hypothetical protein
VKRIRRFSPFGATPNQNDPYHSDLSGFSKFLFPLESRSIGKTKIAGRFKSPISPIGTDFFGGTKGLCIVFPVNREA